MKKDWLIDQLPAVMRDERRIIRTTRGADEGDKTGGPFIRRFTGIFQEIATGIREEADAVPDYFDIGIAPHDFVQWMGSWTGLPVEIDYGDAETTRQRLKNMVGSSGSIYKRRGTRGGLEDLISTVTGQEATVTDTGGIFRLGDDIPERKHVTVGLPDSGDVSVPVLRALLEEELPVDCSFELVIGGRIVASRDRGTRRGNGSL